MGKLGVGSQSRSSDDWLEVHIWLSLNGPQLKGERKIKEAVSYESSPGYVELIVRGIIVWLPGLFVKIVV